MVGHYLLFSFPPSVPSSSTCSSIPAKVLVFFFILPFLETLYMMPRDMLFGVQGCGEGGMEMLLAWLGFGGFVGMKG